jgi:hypothetical protein
MLTKLTAGMNFSTKNQTRGSSLHRAVDTVWQRLHSVVREPQRQDSITARARPSRCPERDQSQEGIPVTTQIEFAIRDWLKKKGATVKTQSKRAGTRKRS